jgi:hypothetical protein
MRTWAITGTVLTPGGPCTQLGSPFSNEHGRRTPVNITETMLTLEGREMVGISNNIQMIFILIITKFARF